MTGFELVDPDNLGFSMGGWEIFQHAPFLEIYAGHYGWEVVQHHGLLLATRRMPGLGMLRAQLFSPEVAARRDWDCLIEDLSAGQLEIMTNHPSRSSNLVPSSAADLYSMVVDLRIGVEGLFTRFEGRARKAVRRASKEGMRVRLAADQRDVSDFHVLLGRVTEGGRCYDLPPLALLHALYQSGNARLYLAFYRNRMVGGVFVLTHRYASGLVSGFAPQECEGLPGNLLYWEAMLGEMEVGMPFFDMGAQSLARNPGLTLAKRSYSPVLVPAFRYELTPSLCRHKLLEVWKGLTRLAR